MTGSWPPEPVVRPRRARRAHGAFGPRRELVLAKLRAQIAYAWERSPFYRRRWQASRRFAGQLRTLADLARFPLSRSTTCRQRPGGASAVRLEPLLLRERRGSLQGTSGTTGAPTLFGISRDDWARVGAAHARIMWGFGLRPGDTVFIGSFFTLYLGSWGALAGAEALGATALPFGAGVPARRERAVELMRRLASDRLLRHALLCPPPRACRARAGRRPGRARLPDHVLFGRGRRRHPGYEAADRGDLRCDLHRHRVDGRDDAVDDERRVRRAHRHAPLGRHRLHGDRRPARRASRSRATASACPSTPTSSARRSR